MNNIRAKFKCDAIERTMYGNEELNTIKLSPVYADNNEENKKFYKYTPCGKIELGTINLDVAKSFELGKFYYIDFIKAE